MRDSIKEKEGEHSRRRLVRAQPCLLVNQVQTLLLQTQQIEHLRLQGDHVALTAQFALIRIQLKFGEGELHV